MGSFVVAQADLFVKIRDKEDPQLLFFGSVP